MLEVMTKLGSDIEMVRNASTILLPKNRNQGLAVAWLRINGFDVPDFPGKKAKQVSEGQTYKLVRDPEIISDVEEGEPGEVIGFLGEDKREELAPWLSMSWLGKIAGRGDFVLAAAQSKIAETQAKLASGETISVATTYKNWVPRIGAALGVYIEPYYKSGSVEAYAEDYDAIADLRLTGQSLRENQIGELMILKEGIGFGLANKPQETV